MNRTPYQVCHSRYAIQLERGEERWPVAAQQLDTSTTSCRVPVANFATDTVQRMYKIIVGFDPNCLGLLLNNACFQLISDRRCSQFIRYNTYLKKADNFRNMLDSRYRIWKGSLLFEREYSCNAKLRILQIEEARNNLENQYRTMLEESYIYISRWESFGKITRNG